MAVSIRMTRRGTKKKPFYRIVAAHSEFKRDGRFLEILGTHNPCIEQNQTKLKLERISYWLGQGAKASDTVKSLLKRANSQETDTPAPRKAKKKPKIKKESK